MILKWILKKQDGSIWTWTHVIQGRDKWWGVVSKVLILLVLQLRTNSWLAEKKPPSFRICTVLHGIGLLYDNRCWACTVFHGIGLLYDNRCWACTRTRGCCPVCLMRTNACVCVCVCVYSLTVATLHQLTDKTLKSYPNVKSRRVAVICVCGKYKRTWEITIISLFLISVVRV